MRAFGQLFLHIHRCIKHQERRAGTEMTCRDNTDTELQTTKNAARSAMKLKVVITLHIGLMVVVICKIQTQFFLMLLLTMSWALSLETKMQSSFVQVIFRLKNKLKIGIKQVQTQV